MAENKQTFPARIIKDGEVKYAIPLFDEIEKQFKNQIPDVLVNIHISFQNSITDDVQHRCDAYGDNDQCCCKLNSKTRFKNLKDKIISHLLSHSKEYPVQVGVINIRNTSSTQRCYFICPKSEEYMTKEEKYKIWIYTMRSDLIEDINKDKVEIQCYNWPDLETFPNLFDELFEQIIVDAYDNNHMVTSAVPNYDKMYNNSIIQEKELDQS
jgi:hypothetical protein